MRDDAWIAVQARQPIHEREHDYDRHECRMEGVQCAVVASGEVTATGEESLDRADHGQHERPQRRAPVGPGGDERGDEREDVGKVDGLAEVLVRVQPTGSLSEDDASDEVELHHDADDSGPGEDDGSPQPDPLPVHARHPKTSAGRSQLRTVVR